MDGPGTTSGEVAVIGAAVDVAGFALAGARVVPADTAAQVRDAGGTLPASVAVVILTPAAAAALGGAPGGPLTIVLP